MRRSVRSRIAWEDRFETPSVEGLISEFTRPHTQLIQQVRDSLLGLEGVSEAVMWLGIPWRWTLAYRLDSADDRAWAYIVPQPGKPLLALPMSSEMVATLPVRRLPKFIRDVILLSPRVGGVHWMQWELTSRAQVNDLIGLARRKHEAMLGTLA